MQHQNGSPPPSWMVEVTAARGGQPLAVTSRLSRLEALKLTHKISIHGIRARDGETYAPTKLIISIAREEVFEL